MSGRFLFMCLDLRQSAVLVWSCARARALQEQTRLEWEPYRETKVLNAIYGVLFWKGGPGTAEIRQDQNKIDALTSTYFDHMFDVFVEKSITLGPSGLSQYVDGLVAARAYSLQSVEELFQDASGINADVIGEAQHAIRTLATVKLASALTLTGTGCTLALAGAGVSLVTQVGLVKLGADVTGEIVKAQDNIGANVKGIAYQVLKSNYGAEKGADKGAEHIGRVGEEGVKRYGPKLASAQLRIERYSAELARRFRSRKAVKIGRRLTNAKADHAMAGRALTGAQRAVKASKVAGKAVPLVFAAWDVIDAWNEYVEDTAAAN